MVVVGASGLAGALALPNGAAAAPADAGPWTSVADLGITPGNEPAANRAALVAGLSNSSARVYFPPGDYRVDNSEPNVVVAGFTGVLLMAPGARLVFTDKTWRGLVFAGGAGARFSGVSTAFAVTPTKREDAQECITFDGTTDTYVEDIRIDGSAAAGLVFWRCVRPVVVGALVTRTMADGVHFANCQDGRADHITTVDTGDDGVAFLNYASGPDHTGGLATNLSVTRSAARGVAVCGQSGVTIRDAVIDTTAGPGLLCTYDDFWKSRVPDDVAFERVRISGSGANGTEGGLRILRSGRVTADRITIVRPGFHGVHAEASTAVTLTDISVRDAPGHGFLLQGGTHQVDRLVAADTNGIGFNSFGCDRLEYGTITLRNVARTHHTSRAISIENTARVYGGRAWIYDTQATATGYVVGAYGTQKGSLGTLIPQLGSRALTVTNPSGVGYLLA